MSAINYYLEAGYTPINKCIAVNGLDTFTVHAPSASDKCVHVTNLSVSCNSTGTIAFYYDNGNAMIAQFVRAGSFTLVPEIGCWQSTVRGGRIFGKLGGASGTDGALVNATVFEVN